MKALRRVVIAKAKTANLLKLLVFRAFGFVYKEPDSCLYTDFFYATQ